MEAIVLAPVIVGLIALFRFASVNGIDGIMNAKIQIRRPKALVLALVAFLGIEFTIGLLHQFHFVSDAAMRLAISPMAISLFVTAVSAYLLVINWKKA